MGFFNKEFKIGDKWVGENHPTYFIAEIGANFDGSIEKAKKLIDGGYAGKNVVFGIRPEDIYDSAEHLDKFASCKIDSDVTGYELLGAEVLLYFTVAGANMSARVDSDTPARYGDHIELAFDPHKIHVFDKETELTITN